MVCMAVVRTTADAVSEECLAMISVVVFSVPEKGSVS
jgi:hypothetical protein